MSEKTFRIVGGDLSDGYHTFDELYEHGCLLFLTWLVEEKTCFKGRRAVYYLPDHFDGWDLVATNIGQKQISYHVPAKYRDILEKHFVPKSDLESIWDGHTAADVARRLEGRLREK